MRRQLPFLSVNNMELVKKYNKEITIGGFSLKEHLLIIAGPCSIENEVQMMETAAILVQNGVHFLRASIYKPRTSPYSFQGIGEQGFEIIEKVKSRYPIMTVSEIVSADDLGLYEKYTDIIQVGTRNMQNFELLKALGKSTKPVLLKRGFGNTIEEWLNAAEYLLSRGNDRVILCERGIRTFENMTRNTLDISSIPIVKRMTGLPIIADPSHASGRSDLIRPLSLAAIAAGADGLMVEVHPHPAQSVSDKDQAIGFSEFGELLSSVRKIASCLGRNL